MTHRTMHFMAERRRVVCGSGSSGGKEEEDDRGELGGAVEYARRFDG